MNFAIATLTMIGALSIACALVWRAALTGTSVPRPIRLFMQSVFPPRDLYVNIGEASLEGNSISLSFVHKYTGTYQMGVMTTRDVRTGTSPLNGKILLGVTCETMGRIIFSAELGEESTPWWMAKGAGVILRRYEVPEDMPRATAIDCHVRIERIAGISNEDLKTLRFYVRKYSEE